MTHVLAVQERSISIVTERTFNIIERARVKIIKRYNETSVTQFSLHRRSPYGRSKSSVGG